MKIIFTWWNKQTFGTFLKTLFFGKYVGSDEYGNKYYKNKKHIQLRSKPMLSINKIQKEK